jgi:hypothetical protein
LVLLQIPIKLLNKLISAIKFKEKQKMSTNKNLFKEAIADAKAVREAALENAKAALHEALTPQLQAMLSTKLQEMDKEENVEESFVSSHEDSEGTNLNFNLEEEDSLEEDFDLSEILAELGEEEKLDEAKEEDEEKLDEAKEEDEESEEEAEEEEGEEEAEEEGEDEVGKMSVEALKDLITSIIHNELEQEEYETSADEAGEEMGIEAGEEAGEGDEIDLEELLAELDATENLEESESLNENVMAELLPAVLGALGMATTGWSIVKMQDWLAKKNPELYKSLQKIGSTNPLTGEKVDEAKKAKEEKDEKDEMKEAIDTINTLRNELNETNLLNAKLLYVNKIFKAKNLTESQKLKVIASFDKATNVKEAKIVFESLSNAIATPAKKAIKESLGFASKAAGVAPNRTIVESNDVISRMQKLANIIK